MAVGVGDTVGETVGDVVGDTVGEMVGEIVGEIVGVFDASALLGDMVIAAWASVSRSTNTIVSETNLFIALPVFL